MKHERLIQQMVQDIAEAHGDDPYAPDWMVALAISALAIYLAAMSAFWCYLRAAVEA